MLAAIISIVMLKCVPNKRYRRLAKPLMSYAPRFILLVWCWHLRFIANYSGLSATLALALAHTGKAFTFFSPF